MKNSGYIFLSVLMAICILPIGANAVGISCPPGDMTLNGSAANACLLFQPTGPGVENTPDLTGAYDWGWGEWDALIKTDGPTTTTLQGLQFTVAATTVSDANPYPSGTWTVTISDTNGDDALNLPTVFDLAAALKAGNSYEAFFFDNRVVYSGANNGTWQITFTTVNQGNGAETNPNLSHLSLYLRHESDLTNVPEPSSLLLIGTGMLGLGLVARKRIKK